MGLTDQQITCHYIANLKHTGIGT